MNKKLLIVIVAILVLIGGGTAFLLLRGDEEPEQDSQTTTTTVTADQSSDTPETMTPASETAGQYVDYDEAALATTEGTKLIFFHAPWCPQCRALEKDILDKGVPSGVTIFKLDYDTNQDLRQKYGVTLQTTIVEVDENGNELDSFVAYDEPTLEAVKENLL